MRPDAFDDATMHCTNPIAGSLFDIWIFAYLYTAKSGTVYTCRSGAELTHGGDTTNSDADLMKET